VAGLSKPVTKGVSPQVGACKCHAPGRADMNAVLNGPPAYFIRVPCAATRGSASARTPVDASGIAATAAHSAAQASSKALM